MEWKSSSKFIQYCTRFAQFYRPNVIMRRNVNLSFKIIVNGDDSIDDPPVILLHGFFETKKHWEGLGKTIHTITKKPVVTVDLRNHGDSPHTGSHKYKENVADVLQLLNKLSLNKAIFLGHSMGGMVCMCLSLMEPKKVAGVLVVDISPVTPNENILKLYPEVLRIMSEISFKNITKIRVARRLARKKLRHIVTEDATMKIILSNVDKKPDGTVGWTCNVDVLLKYMGRLALLPWSLANRKYSGPALFIGGQLSEYLPADDLSSIRTLYPRAVITYIKGAGHYVHVDDPRTFLEYAIAFTRATADG